MQQYIIRRVFQMIPVLFIISVVVFGLMHLVPGDPVAFMIGEDAINLENMEEMRRQLGLDKPLPVQYLMWVQRAAQGDLGRSVRSKLPVRDEIARRLPVTLQLAVASILVSVLIGIPVGIIAAVHRNSKLDVIATVLSMSGVAMPSFWQAILLIFLFSLILRWLPVAGYVNIFENPIGGLRAMILPAIVLGTHQAAVLTRQTRSAMLEVMAMEYIATARAKGLAERTVIWMHALKNALLPVVTVLSLQVGRVLGGAVIIETIFAWPGLGRLTVQAIAGHDFQVVQAMVLFAALITLASNLMADILYGWLDPRIRYS
ncbi:MAG: ABC transporter permease [Chloroflexi bacterium]|nr:ABC transporter permease [Chloroflexota bacterium]